MRCLWCAQCFVEVRFTYGRWRTKIIPAIRSLANSMRMALSLTNNQWHLIVRSHISTSSTSNLNRVRGIDLWYFWSWEEMPEKLTFFIKIEKSPLERGRAVPTESWEFWQNFDWVQKLALLCNALRKFIHVRYYRAFALSFKHFCDLDIFTGGLPCIASLQYVFSCILSRILKSNQ